MDVLNCTQLILGVIYNRQLVLNQKRWLMLHYKIYYKRRNMIEYVEIVDYGIL